MLPQRCVTANLDAICAGAEFDLDRERVASWLPLYHDMGLIGLLGVPMTTGVDLVIAGPQDFLAAPARWMDWMSTFGCTVTGGPNFLLRSPRARSSGPTTSISRVGVSH